SLLPRTVRLLSGPGCPVCVTPAAYLDRAIALSFSPDTVVATFGDMVRVPGTESSLERASAEGGSVRVVYSPADALKFAENEPGTRVVFLGVGFETTAPAVAWTVKEARNRSISNYSVLCGHKTIPEAMEALLSAGEASIDGFMCPGHVSVITGANAYSKLCAEYGVPCVVAGFEAADMAKAIAMLVRQVSEGRSEVEIQYTRSVDAEGNLEALKLCGEVFEPCDAVWRGLGTIPHSGLKIRGEFSGHDAETVMEKEISDAVTGADEDAGDPPGCICGEVLRGIAVPPDCPLFGKRCTPGTPVGPCMVSSEGTCAAYYRYGGERKTGDETANHANLREWGDEKLKAEMRGTRP
ncbi:MAG: hydrogenase formation protein HypD, partial [Kiritimatiellia bacterium]